MHEKSPQMNDMLQILKENQANKVQPKLLNEQQEIA